MKIMCRGFIDPLCKVVYGGCSHFVLTKFLGKKCVWTCRVVHLNGLLVLCANQLFFYISVRITFIVLK